MKRSTLSAVMANYNHGQYVARAIEAVTEQSRPPDEYLIIDDASTDDSIQIIESYARRYSYIRFLRNDTNRGAVATFQRLFQTATGDYVYPGAADDFVLPGFFEKSMEMLQLHTHAGLCCSDPVWLDKRTGRTTATPLGWSWNARYLSPWEMARKLNGGFIPGHPSIVKRSALVEAGGHLPQLAWHCDWFACLVIAFRHGICYVPEPLATLTTYDSSYSAAGRRSRREQQEIVDQVLRLLKSPSYRDVVPFFCRSGALLRFGSEVTRIMLTNPEHWDLRTLKMARGPLLREANRLRSRAWSRARSVVSRVTPQFVKRAYQRMRSLTLGAA